MAKSDINEALRSTNRRPAIETLFGQISIIAKGAIAGIGIALAIVGVLTFVSAAWRHLPAFTNVDATMIHAAWIGACIGGIVSFVTCLATNNK